MTYILQVDFKMDGPFGKEMTDVFTDLAKSINAEPGFIWKIWTENQETNEAGGIYNFETKETAQKYLDMHTKRLTESGITDIRAKIFSVNGELTGINNGPVK